MEPESDDLIRFAEKGFLPVAFCCRGLYMLYRISKERAFAKRLETDTIR